MNLRHAAALALVGWYLMVPPMAGDLDETCKSGGRPALSDVTVALLTWTNPDVVNMRRCDRLRNELRYGAPLSDWSQAGSFETLAACEAEWESSQRYSLNNEGVHSRGVAKLQLSDEGEQHPSDEDLQFRAQTVETSAREQTLSMKCIATDDPRLKGN